MLRSVTPTTHHPSPNAGCAQAGDHDVHAGWPTAGEGAFEGRPKLLRTLDVLAVGAEAGRDQIVARRQQVGGHHAVRAVDGALAVALGGPTGVVADDRHERQVVTDGRVELHAVKAEGAVADERHRAHARPSERGADGERDARAERAELAAGDQLVWAAAERPAGPAHEL